MTRECSMHGREYKCTLSFARKHKEKTPLVQHKHKSENYNEMEK
jgi:hypothetical protein